MGGATLPQLTMYEELNDKIVESPLRDYVGLSMVGHNCYRYLQYNHYWAFTQKITSRIDRLFKVGHDAESKMILDLNMLGIEIEDQQIGIVGFAGHWRGHPDGKAVGWNITKKTLWEAKTHNEKSFNDLKKKGMRASKPAHYSQMTVYMGYLEYEQGLYHALNKNTSEYYFETIEFDLQHFNDLKVKQSDIITTDGLFPRIGNNSKAWFECKFCEAKYVCFGETKINMSCRTCAHVEVADKGVWDCTKHKKTLTVEEQLMACPDYTLWEMFK